MSKNDRHVKPSYLISALPFIMGAVITVIVGVVSYMFEVENRTIYLRMAISMSCFYILGIYVKAVLIKTIEEVSERKKEEERLRLEKEAMEAEDHKKASRIDYITEDDDFSPLAVSEVIKSRMSD